MLMIGFDMSTMNSTYFDEGLIDINAAKEIVTNEVVIKVSPCLLESIGGTDR
jgi:hypothetical protein